MKYFLILIKSCQKRDYARWRSTYIHKCIQNGEAPQPPVKDLSPELSQIEFQPKTSYSEPMNAAPVFVQPSSDPFQVWYLLN